MVTFDHKVEKMFDAKIVGEEIFYEETSLQDIADTRYMRIKIPSGYSRDIRVRSYVVNILRDNSFQYTYLE